MPSRPTKYEKQKAKEHGAKHLGGPGKPDYVRGNVIGEVKDRKSPVNKTELERMVERGVRELDSKAGVTDPALIYAKKVKVKVFSRGKRLA